MTDDTNETTNKAPSPRAPEAEGAPVTVDSLIPPNAVRPQNTFNTLLGEMPAQPIL